MSFYSRGFGRKGKGRDNRPRVVWKHSRNKKIIFSMHSNVDSEEFNQLATTGHLFLGSPNVSCQPSISHVPYQSPFQPHPNIHEILEQNFNDGWNQIPSSHPDENQGWVQLVNPPYKQFTQLVF